MTRLGSLVRGWLPLVAILALAAVLRVPWLGAMPNPCGDEGNWTWIAFDLYARRPAALPPDARFVSMAFARLIALAYDLFGPSFAAARAVLVAGALVAIPAVYALLRALGARRAAWGVSLVLAAHPWSVAWSRSVTVPYALAFDLALVGTLAWLLAVERRSALGLFLAAQALSVAMHFSPLALIPLGAASLWLLTSPVRRELVKRPSTWFALIAGSLHVVPMLVAGVQVAHTADGRPRYYFTEFPRRLWVFGRTLLGGLGGESTLRHFTGTQWPLPAELLVIAGVCVTLFAAWRKLPPPPSPDRERGDRGVRSFSLLYFALALVGLPIILAPARPWNLPAIDAERYVFVCLAPFALALGALAERRDRSRWLAVFAVAWLVAMPLRRGVTHFLAGGGPDRGFYTLAGGGGYRGWKVPREREALPVLIRREVDRAREGRPATIVVSDYAFHPLHFVNAEGGSPTVDIVKFPLPERRGELHVFVVWADGMFAPGFTPRDWIDVHRRLVTLMRSEAFTGLRRVRTFVQPDGTPLIELWAATRR